MCKSGKVFILPLLFVALNFSSVFAQVPQIINPDNDTLHYCNDSVLISPEILISDIDINEDSEGMKISVVNYKRDEDILVYDEDPRFKYSWVNYYGYLEIKGIGSAEEYQAAIRKVYYKNVATVPNLDTRTFTISLLDADYLPSTKHFYRYIEKLDVTWKEAKVLADSMSYYGLQGYLATITSSDENNFIWTKIDGIGWIGASDEETEGDWKWVTGPEAGTLFWRGGVNGSRVNNEYSNWATGTEPNNAGDEDFAHINQNPNKPSKSWNDLENTGDGPNSQYYRSQGFIVEFGGIDGEPDLKLSATATIKVSKIAFSDEREFEICQGESQELNFETSEAYSYLWMPDEEINSITVSSPIVSPNKTTNYRVIGQLDFCVDSADFKVNVNPIPIYIWDYENIICEGASIELNPGEHTSYLWENLDTTSTITVSNEGWYSVKLTNEFACKSEDSTRVKWSILPTLDYSELDTLVCGRKQNKINLSFENGEASTNLFSINSKANIIDANTLSPTIVVDKFGVYSFEMEVIDVHNCEFLDTFNVEFHNQPEAIFLLDEEKCQGYNLDLSFTGNTIEPALFSWLTNDSVFASGNDLTEIMIPLGYGLRDRTVGLIVNEQGCVDSITVGVNVTPAMNFWVEENAEGCTPLSVKFGNSDVEDIDEYSWDFGDGDSAFVEKPSHIYLNSGVSDLNFDVKLTVISVEGCENIGILNNAVTVHPIPSLDLSFEENICYSEQATVFYTGSGNENDLYNWDLTGFLPDEILQDPQNSAGPFEFKRSSQPTVEIGIQVVSEFGCETDYFSRMFSRKPIFNVVQSDVEGCVPLEVEFNTTSTDLVDDVEYSWHFGDGNSAIGNQVYNVFSEPGKKFDINLIGNSSTTGCSDTVIFTEGVFAFPQPVASFIPTPEAVTISNPLIQFENVSENATFYEWNFGDSSLISNEINPEHSFTAMGFFDVKLSAFNDFGCTDTTIRQVAVAFDKLFPPTAFSPNATLDEDREFRIYSLGIANDGYQLLIFNRWGEVIFESQSQEHGWDGKMKNDNFAPAGVYTWVIQYLDFRGEKHKQQGTVTLLF